MKSLKDIIPSLPTNNLQELHDNWLVLAKEDLYESVNLHKALEEEESRIISLLPNLSSLKIVINRYSEFDSIRYHFDYSPFDFSIAFRPKGEKVSFWCARLEDCAIQQ